MRMVLKLKVAARHHAAAPFITRVEKSLAALAGGDNTTTSFPASSKT